MMEHCSKKSCNTSRSMQSEPVNCSSNELRIYLELLGEGYLPCVNSEPCTSSPELGEGFLPTYYSDTNRSVQLKSMSIASRSYRHGKKTVVFHGFPFLQMSSNLTATRGEELSMSYPVDFRVKTLAWPGRDWDWLESVADYGVRCSASFAKWDQNTSSWKTRQCSLLGGLTSYLGIWPRWGLMRDGECWALPMLEPRTYGSEFGLWPTPCKFDQTKSMPHELEIRNGRPTTISSKGKTGSSPLRAWAAVFPEGALEVGKHWPPEPGMARMVHGVAYGVDRIGAIGNGQVPICAAMAFRLLAGGNQ